MWISFFIGQLPKLSKNEKAKELLRNAPSYVQKWQEVLGSFQDGEKPSMEIDLDFYDDEVVETIDEDIKVTGKKGLIWFTFLSKVLNFGAMWYLICCKIILQLETIFTPKFSNILF